jgi:uncharacterized LabA/DUF88 family protein
VNVSFVVDGFNLYHSILDMRRDNGNDYRWLDLRAMCRGRLYTIHPKATLGDVFYFSALATHLQREQTDKLERHHAYLAALTVSGVHICLGRFKSRRIEYRSADCYVKLRRHEEKESDVSMALKLVELAGDPACAAVVLVSGDTDLAPAVRAAKEAAPAKPVYVMFPYRRAHDELRSLATKASRLGEPAYAASQFPERVESRSGRSVHRPPEWQ